MCGWVFQGQSWTCVPNANRLALLAPAFDENVCPHWAERWELRTRPLGCQVSTITTLTSLVTIASTLVAVLLGCLAVLGARRLRAYDAAHPGWWQAWRWVGRGKRDGRLAPETPQGTERSSSTGPPGEREPLLPS